MRKGENIYKRKDGRWEGRYIRGRKESGKVTYGYIYGKTLNDVRNKLYPLKVKYQTILQMKGASSEPFSFWCTQWLGKMKHELKPSTFATYQYKLKKYVIPFIGSSPLNELTNEVGYSLIHRLRDKLLSERTIKGIFLILNQCLKKAVDLEKLTTHPFSGVKLPKCQKTKIRSLTVNEQTRLEKVAINEKKSKGLPVILALYSGMRIGEIAALQWKDIDFDSNAIHVNHNYQRVSIGISSQKTQVVYGTAKTDSSNRVIPLGSRLKKLLLQHKKKSRSEFVFSSNGHPCEPRLLTYHFHKIREKASLSMIHFHQLRHTFATRCLESKGDILSISAILGHASTQMTLDTYSDSMMEQRKLVISRLEKQFHR